MITVKMEDMEIKASGFKLNEKRRHKFFKSPVVRSKSKYLAVGEV